MYSVTLEVTHEGYTWKVLKDGELFAQHVMKRDPDGARGVERFSIFESIMEKEYLDDVLEGIEDGDPFEIMLALGHIEE